jgi:pilus assembly protein CpaE
VLSIETQEDFEHFRRLREAFLGHPMLAVLPEGMEYLAFVAAMRAGAAQVVPLPFDDVDFRMALDAISMMFGFGAGGSNVVVVSGVTGGCGATMLATNLAYEISQTRRQRTILLELSSQMGMVATHLDVTPRHSTHDLLSNIDRIDLDTFRDSLTEITDWLSIIPGPQQLLAPRDVSSRDVHQLLDFAKRLAPVVVVDLPNTFNDVYFETLSVATHVLLVAEQKLPSVRAMKVVWDTLQRDVGLGVEGAKRLLVVNRYSPKVREFTLESLEKTLGAAPIHAIANDHAAVNGAINHGRPLRIHDPRAKPLADIENLIKAMFGAPQSNHAGGGVFGRMRRAFGLG